MDKNLITFTLSSNFLVEDTSKGSETAITEVRHDVRNASDDWYTIDGIRLGQKPTAKGIYIYKGRKYVNK